METTVKTNDMLEVLTALNGKMNVSNIYFVQVLQGEKGGSINDLMFVTKRYGLYFYTSRTFFEGAIFNENVRKEQPCYVCAPNSNNVYRLQTKLIYD